jgi:hypothetical protein
LRESGHDVSFTGLNDHVIDVMKRTHLYEKIGEDHFYHTVAEAVSSIHKGTCLVDKGYRCPLLAPKFPAFDVADESGHIAQRRQEWMAQMRADKEDDTE